jgi:predicted nucleotidyltransferase
MSLRIIFGGASANDIPHPSHGLFWAGFALRLSISLEKPCQDAPRSDFCYNEPMERDEAIARLRAHEAELRQLGIEHLYLFDSTARGEARADSDVDLFFDHPIGSIGLYELIDLKRRASEILEREADIMTRRSLHRVLRDRVEKSALNVF